MRLLSSDSLVDQDRLVFKDFPDEQTVDPGYAILSHTWGDEEVTYQEILFSPRSEYAKREGYRKIELCAKQAKKEGWPYFWIDTCCIDKTNSTELSEAINSMYRWYKNSKVCYAYLSDVSVDRAKEKQQRAMEALPQMAKCRWFTRGWTLQELLAPSKLRFFGRGWCYIGSKGDFRNEIERITGISTWVLLSGDYSDISVGRRMSWAANRHTSRIEDRAYCLMGLFDVNMPMLYGEGEKAFTRLQEEIMRVSDDMTLFCWHDTASSSFAYRGLLARTSAEFAAEQNKESYRALRIRDAEPHQLTNKGLKIQVLLSERGEDGSYVAFLNDQRTSLIFLEKLSTREYARLHFAPPTSHQLKDMRQQETKLETIYVRQTLLLPDIVNPYRVAGYYVEMINGHCKVEPSNLFDGHQTVQFDRGNFNGSQRPTVRFQVNTNKGPAPFDIDFEKDLVPFAKGDNTGLRVLVETRRVRVHAWFKFRGDLLFAYLIIEVLETPGEKPVKRSEADP